MTRFQVAVTAAMVVKDLVPVLFTDATTAMAVTGAVLGFGCAVALMLLDGWRKRRAHNG